MEWKLPKKTFSDRKTKKIKKEKLDSYNKFDVIANEENYKFGNKYKSEMSAKKTSAQNISTKSYGRNQTSRTSLLTYLQMN